MRSAFLATILALCAASAGAQATPVTVPVPAPTPQPPASLRPYVPTNMKPYFLGMYLKAAGAAEDPSPELMRGHLAHLRTEVEAGKVLIAGPALDAGTLGGLAVMAVATAEEAKQIMNDDPLVKSGRMTAEVHPVWLPDLSPVQLIYPKAGAQ